MCWVLARSGVCLHVPVSDTFAIIGVGERNWIPSDFSSYGIGSIEIIAPSRVIPARNFDEGAAQRINKQKDVENYLHGRRINSIFCHYFQENLKQRRF